MGEEGGDPMMTGAEGVAPLFFCFFSVGSAAPEPDATSLRGSATLSPDFGGPPSTNGRRSETVRRTRACSAARYMIALQRLS